MIPHEEPPAAPRSYRGIAWRALLFWVLTFILLILFAIPVRLLRRFLRRSGVEIAGMRDVSASDPILVPVAIAEIAAVVLATRFMMRRDGLGWRDIGLGSSNRLRDLGLGIAIGTASFSLVPLLGLIGGWVELASDPALAVPGAIGGVLVSLGIVFLALLPAAAFEEIGDRGYVFTLLAERSAVVAVLATSLLFTLMHSLNDGFNAIAFFHVFLAGCSLGIARLRSGALWLPIGWHFAWNAAQGWIFGCAVSGMRPADPALLPLRFDGPQILTGGSFGPESGLLAFAAEVMTLVFYLRFIPARPRRPPDQAPGPTATSAPIDCP